VEAIMADYPKDRMPELTEAEQRVLIEEYFRQKPRRDLIEKRRLEQAELNSDEARRGRGVDPKPWGF
jgi:hypothetical protein